MDKVIEFPLVSVIMPVYNVAGYVNYAIESILNQTLTNFELIIIDDYSTDETVSVINSIKDNRIKLIEKAVHTGLSESLNLGISIAKGKFIARMDGDDLSCSHRLERQVNFLTHHPEIAICGSAIEIIGKKEIIQFPSEHEELKIALLDVCPMAHPTVMFCASFLKKESITYDKDFDGAEDYELWTRCIWLGQMANLPQVLLKYRTHSQQVSATKSAVQISLSNNCRQRMLKTIYQPKNQNDRFVEQFLQLDHGLISPENLARLSRKIDDLLLQNELKSQFQPAKFKYYCLARKRLLIRRYFLNQALYHPKLLAQVLFSKTNFATYFNTNEIIRFVVKCLLFKKK